MLVCGCLVQRAGCSWLGASAGVTSQDASSLLNAYSFVSACQGAGMMLSMHLTMACLTRLADGSRSVLLLQICIFVYLAPWRAGLGWARMWLT